MKVYKLFYFVFFGLFVLIGFALLSMLFFDSSVLLGSGNIALVSLTGDISSSSGFSGGENVFSVISLLDKAEKDLSVKAIVLEINSGGGSVVATKQLVDRIRRIKKPVVAWISDIGTSGAYYAASATDLIVADEDSITGSIGVISILPNFAGLLEKVGVEVQVVKEGKNKDFASPFKKLTDEEARILQEMLSNVFKHFKRDVLVFRGSKLDKNAFEKIADGRIISGEQALDVGLVDKLGSRHDAVLEAGKLAGISGEPIVKEFKPKPKTFFELLSRTGFFFGKGFRAGLLSEDKSLLVQAK